MIVCLLINIDVVKVYEIISNVNIISYDVIVSGIFFFEITAKSSLGILKITI